MIPAPETIFFCDLGLLDYDTALGYQKRLHQLVATGAAGGFVLTLQHPPVVTLGRNSSLDNLLKTPEALARDGIKVIRCERGGEVTAHEPGQLVVYPILPMRLFNHSVRAYITSLEQLIVQLLLDFDVRAHTNSAYPGVWVGSGKIAAVGVRVSSRTSFHGLALNVCNDFLTFSHVVPCGLRHGGITSLAKEIHKNVTVAEVGSKVLEIFSKQLCKFKTISAKECQHLIDKANTPILKPFKEGF